MIKIETSVVINRPVEEVFEFTDNVENAQQWQSELSESEYTSEPPVQVGTTVRQARQYLGRRFESTWEITEYEPNRKVRFKATSGPIPFEGEVTLDSVEGGTKYTVVIEAEPGGFFKLAEPIVARTTQREWETNVATLKDLLEARA